MSTRDRIDPDSGKVLASNEHSPGLYHSPRTRVGPTYKPVTVPSKGDRLEAITEKCAEAGKTIDRLKAAMADKIEQINTRRQRFIRTGYTSHLGVDGFRFKRDGTQVTIWHARGPHEGLPYITDSVRPELAEYMDAVLRHLSPVETTTDAVIKAAFELNSAKSEPQDNITTLDNKDTSNNG